MITTVRPGRRLARAALTALLAGIVACNFGEQTAGGSSEVDNPVVLALIDSSGARLTVSGSLGLYLADQSPALDPSPRLEIRLENVDTIVLNAKLLATAGLGDSARLFNLYLKGDDSTGSFVQNLLWNPSRQVFTRGDSISLKKLNVTIAPLIRSESVLQGSPDTSSEVNRIIIPGSPFQAVVVDSVFVFEAIPPGVFPVHVLTPGGTELPLPEPVDTEDPKYHRVNRDTIPVTRPAPPPPVPDFTVNGGVDRTVYSGTETTLSAEIVGARHDDKRLAVLWKQLPPANSASGYALIERPTKQTTKVFFPRTGAYTFVVTAVLGNQQVTDTVTIGVQSSPQNPVFIEPGPGDTLYWYQFFRILWQGARHETLNLEFSRDSGATWLTHPMFSGIASKPGFNERFWQPLPPDFAEQPGTNCFLRLRSPDGTVSTTSERFVLMYYPMDPPYGGHH